MNLTPRKSLILFTVLVVFLFAQAIWWVTFMEILANEKVEIATKLGASSEYLELLHQEERSRQIMIGLEGTVFLLVILAGVWLIYRSLRKLEELKFHQENFLMAVTHELKTPLASILMYLDTIESEKISADKKVALVPRMKEDVNHLSKLVDNILDAGRFERSGYRLRLEWFDLSKLVSIRLDTFEDAPGQKFLKIHRKIEANLRYYGDRKALTRAIDAILENSIKYGAGDNAEIDVAVRAGKKEIQIHIADNGIGLESRDLGAIFERFYRVGGELAGRSEGSGLGLYLCREIILAHGGGITAHSDGLGKGTKFTIKLQRSKRSEDDTVDRR
ncbi:MAG: HAMP domain-containing histidine kinase [candidate division Zixibacteria bacterium]|nr:HAMP domain-containing histidine kinase [candidate division Zixibacteria bacterium]